MISRTKISSSKYNVCMYVCMYVGMYVCIISLIYITGLSNILAFSLLYKKKVKRLNQKSVLKK